MAHAQVHNGPKVFCLTFSHRLGYNDQERGLRAFLKHIVKSN